MNPGRESRLAEVLDAFGTERTEEWCQGQLQALSRRTGSMRAPELRGQCEEFLRLLRAAARSGRISDQVGREWDALREMLGSISRTRGQQGYSPTETAMFVFSLKHPLFALIRREFSPAADDQAALMAEVTTVLDSLGLYTTEIYQKTREEIILRQQEEMLELSTPVVRLWDGILALPMIGTLDSGRMQAVMESLLQQIVDTGSPIAIIDITGVPTVDTLTAQHLLKTVTAARLMGAECIISGIRPQIAQTIVHLGVDLGPVVTKARLSDAFAVALSRTGQTITRSPARA